MKKYQITVQPEQLFEIEAQAAHQLDMVAQLDGSFHVLQNNQSYHVTLVEQDESNKQLKLSVNGKIYRVFIEDEYDQLIKQLGLEVVSSVKIDEIKAPMPGLVLDINVSVGQTIEKGDSLLILEAMKMENVIKSAGEGVVKEIIVAKGAAVEKGALLILLE